VYSRDMDKDKVIRIKDDLYANSKFEWISQPAVDSIIARTPEEYKKLVFELVGDDFTKKPISEWVWSDHKNMGLLSMYEYLDDF
jgi:hypothetical protein